jgi:hypothetical protein
MPIIVSWLGGMLLSVVGQMAISALVSLGITAVASKVVPGLIDTIGIKQMLGAAGPLTDYLGWFGVDTAITIVLSAWAGRKITDAAALHFASKRKPSAS